jgi:branched-chain amino acid transport system permease protein
LHWPFLVGVLAAVVLAGAVSAVIGAVALRKLRDDYFGITTLAFALILALVIGQYVPLFDGYAGLYNIPQPFDSAGTLGTDGAYFLGICIVALGLTLWFLRRVFRSPFGRALRSVREDDVASQAFSRNVYMLKLKAYILGGCIAGLGGALLAAYITAMNPYGWTPQETFLIYAALFIGGTGNMWGTVIGTFFVEVGIQEVTRYMPAIGNNGSAPDALRLVLIGLLIVGIIWFRPQGVLPEPRARDRLEGEARSPTGAIAALRRLVQPGAWRPSALATATSTVSSAGAGPAAGTGPAGAVPSATTTYTPDAPPAPATVHENGTAGAAAGSAQQTLLEVRDVIKAFGGLRAVDGASFSVPAGSLTGLIGPNGAGKSTAVNLISGFEKPDSGSILFGGRNIAGLPAYAISRLGLMRSFQTPREWPGLTVMENMLLAAPINDRESLWRGVCTPGVLHTAEDRDRELARELLDDVGLLKLKDDLAGTLSGGQKRLLEFARLAAARPQLVLLDEPQAGVNPVLRERMADQIRAMVARGITVLMIEHNLPFLESLCDVVIVMALGKSIASGSMDELRANEQVVDAYLGQVDSADV